MADLIPGNFEQTDFSGKGVLCFAAGIVVLVAGAGLAVWTMARWWNADYPMRVSPPLWTQPERAPAPRLQPSPAADFESVRRTEESQLENYGWIDRQAGVVRIPIERAMDLVVQRGLPVRTPPDKRGVQPAGKTNDKVPPPVRRLNSRGNP